MISIVIEPQEKWDNIKEEYSYFPEKPVTLELEHSLISIMKWEALFGKPFLSDVKKTPGELLTYLQCMTMKQGVDPKLFACITQQQMDEIATYIKDPHTPYEIIGQVRKEGQGRVLTKKANTAIDIYCSMVVLQIPTEFQKWHLNQLLALIDAVNDRNTPEDKKAKRQSKDIWADYEKINEARKAKLGTTG